MTTIATGLTTVLTIVGTLWTLYRGVAEFTLQGRQKRAEMFLGKEKEYFGNPSFNKIRGYLEHDLPELRSIEPEEKRAYLTFFEEIAILMNSGLISADLVFYMFGYYAAKCMESEMFWSNVRKEDIYWNVFLRFAEQMTMRVKAGHIVSHSIRV